MTDAKPSEAPGDHLSVDTCDDVNLRVREWPVPDAPATVVLVHGFAASTTEGCLVAQADALVAAGYAVVSYDSRGHGHSKGSCTLGDLERHDVAAAVRHARAHGRPVLLIGASMGAIAALRAAAEPDADVDGVVAMSCPATWRAPRSAQGILAAGLTQTSLGRALALRLMSVRLAPGWSDPDPPVDLVERIDVPVAVIHGTADRFIPVRNAVELHRHAHEPKRLDLVPGMGHAYGKLATAPILAATDWVLARTLQAA